MLARANRVTRPDDFRTAVRKGRRLVAPSAVVHVLDRAIDGPVRFGFIVNKTVGNAVTRNLVRRRLRAIGHGLVPSLAPGRDVVIRALPGSESSSWVSLQTEISEALDRERVKG